MHINKFNINTYSDSNFDLLKSNVSNISNETKDCIHLILNSNCAERYTSNFINSKLSSIRNNINLNRKLLIKFFDKNNQIHYQLPIVKHSIFMPRMTLEKELNVNCRIMV
ncbi:hypothetical protein [Clostridium botulinum]|uniref:hypothetical protein n=1 Tax=Clostridium botulinum TaxID=1491 RepID=UPI0013FF53FF|nr:hypothetical protein [Clostridium botulinum]MBN1040206.1 hypothetical protein [Clostridium botulinum]MBN1050330.1 hypothetical protein [Clostridium botulinum]NFI52305.1 hypothetical protein [Clostridium botulinum]